MLLRFLRGVRGAVRPGVLATGGVAATAVVVVIATTTGGGGETANLWVNVSGGAAPSRCASACSFNAANAYGSLNAAYAAASPGDSIKVRSGAYGSSTIANRTGMSASRVTVTPATGATVSFTDVDWLASYVTMTGAFTFRTLNVGDLVEPAAVRTTDVTFDGVIVDHQDSTTPSRRAMMVGSTDNLTVRNFDIGNTMAGLNVGEDSNLVQTLGGGTIYTTNLILEQGTFHDNDAPSTTDAHNECVYAVDVAPFTVRRVDFKSCTFYGIFMTDFNNGGVETGDNLTIENNIFRQGQIEGAGGGGYVWAMSFHPQVDETPLTNAVIQNNTIENGLSLGFTGASSGLTVRNNIIAKGIYGDDASSSQCKTGVTFAYNVMPFACGSNTTVRTESQIRADWTSVSTSWGGTEDFHLTGATPAAAGAGDPANFPATDFGGDLRGTPPDAGAYEFGAGGGNNAPSVSVTAPANGATVSGAAVNFTATASDTDGTVSSVQFKVDGTNLGSPDTTAPYVTSWDSTSVSDGSHALTAVATDNIGAQTTSATVAVTVDNVPDAGGQANIWVRTTSCVTTPTRASSPVTLAGAASNNIACNPAQAWNAANAGDTIRVLNGTYTGTMNFSSDKASETFLIGESRNGVILTNTGEIDCGGVGAGGDFSPFCFDGNHMTFQDFTINSGSNNGQTSVGRIEGTDIKFANVHLRGNVPALDINDAAVRFHLDGAEFGDAGNTTRRWCGDGEPIWVAADDVVLEDVFFRPQFANGAAFTTPPCNGGTSVNGFHLEYIRVQDAAHLTVRNSYFSDGDAGSGFLFFSGSGSCCNHVFEGNYFGDGGEPHTSMQANPNLGTCPNWTFRYNTSRDGQSLQCTVSGHVHIGNAGDFGCNGTTTDNVLFSACNGAANDVVANYAALGLNSTGRPNLGSAVIDAGQATCPTLPTDFDGVTRPLGSACDAGAFERTP